MLRVYDTRLKGLYTGDSIINIDFQREMVTLKNERGYHFTRFFNEVEFNLCSGIMGEGDDNSYIYDGDTVVLQDMHPGEKPFYGEVRFLDGSFLIVNEAMNDAENLFNETRPVFLVGNKYKGGRTNE